MKHLFVPSAALLAALALTGCAAHNYDFASSSDAPQRIDRLATDLDRVRADSAQDDEDLYDLRVVPLVHSRLHVFGESDEDDAPDGYVEAELETALPLLAFVDAEVSRYDEQGRLVTRDEFDSALWGAFGKHREVVVTHAGTRERTHHTFLWLFRWTGEETWHPADGPELGSAATP